MEMYDESEDEITKSQVSKIIKTAFGFDDLINIDKVYPKIQPSIKKLNILLDHLFSKMIENIGKTESSENSIEKMFERYNLDEDEDVEYDNKRTKINIKTNIIDLINNTSIKRDIKVDEITDIFKKVGFPSLEGDKVKFIGSTF